MTEEISRKARENRAHRAAKRQGRVLVKSRRRDPNADDYGLYVLPEDRDDAPELFEQGEGISLDAVEASLNWRDVFVVDTEAARVGPVDVPMDRVHVEFYGGKIGWMAWILNDGHPLDFQFGGRGEDVEFAVAQAQEWARGLTRPYYRSVVRYADGSALIKMPSENVIPDVYYEIRDVDKKTVLARGVTGKELIDTRRAQLASYLRADPTRTNTKMVDVAALIKRHRV